MNSRGLWQLPHYFERSWRGAGHPALGSRRDRAQAGEISFVPSKIMPAFRRPISRLVCAGVAAAVLLLWPASAQAQKSGGRSGKKTVQLFPPTTQPAKKSRESFEIGGWAYRAVRSSQPRDGVPWELIVTPAGPNADTWRKGDPGWRTLPMPSSTRGEMVGDRLRIEQNDDNIPVVEIPAVVWKQWMASDLQEVVGIHFHEFVTDDVARILYTLHKVPPDRPDGKPPEPGSSKGAAGVRIEATLLTPVTYCLDQTVVVRVDPLEKEKVKTRSEHEMGHAMASQEVLLDVLRGAQTWKPEQCTGRRSQLTFYWKRELIGRSWKGYRSGVAKVATLRTTVTLVPPTRWSMLLPIPPERVTQKQLQDFNNSIVQLAPAYAKADRSSQDRFHTEHGAYE